MTAPDDATAPEQLPAPSPAARWARGIAGGFLVATLLALLLQGRGEDPWVFTVAVSAMLLAAARAWTGRRGWSDRFVDPVLFGLVLAALPMGRGPWVALFATGTGLAAGFALLLGRFGRKGGLAGLLVVAVAGAALAVPRLQHAPPASEVRVPIHTWNQFHYVLGTKYVDELGYFDLYNAVLLADEQGPGWFDSVGRVRDLHTYEFIGREEALRRAREETRPRFTDERWAQFQRDIEVFYRYRRPARWRGVFTDLGFNPSPVWVLFQEPLLNAVDLHGGRTLGVVGAGQILVHAASFAALWWAFGLRTTLWIALWTLLFFGNRGRMLGGWFSYDWNALALIATALFARGRAAASAPLVAYAGLMRGYVGLVALGPTVRFVYRTGRAVVDRVRGVRRTWREVWEPANLRFLGVLGASMVLLIGGTLVTGRGLEAWVDWYDKIALHGYRIAPGTNHLGLKTLFGEDYFEPGLTLGMDVRREVLADQIRAWRFTAVVLVGWTFALMPRRRPLDAWILGLVPVFAGLVLSRYYYSVFAIFLLLGTTPQRREPRLAAALGMFGILAAFHGTKAFTATGLQWWYQTANFGFLALCLGALVAFTVVDWRRDRAAATTGA